jgi:hypothetical protein
MWSSPLHGLDRTDDSESLRVVTQAIVYPLFVVWFSTSTGARPTSEILARFANLSQLRGLLLEVATTATEGGPQGPLHEHQPRALLLRGSRTVAGDGSGCVLDERRSRVFKPGGPLHRAR